MVLTPLVVGRAITMGAAGVSTSAAGFRKQNQILTANQHLSAALSDPSKAAQNIVPYATNP